MTEPDFLISTCTSYDTVAVAYAEHFKDESAGKPLDPGPEHYSRTP